MFDVNNVVFDFFKTNYLKHKEYEETAEHLIVEYFNDGKDDTNKYIVSRRQDATNYKQMLYDIELKNTEHIIKIEVKTDEASNRTGNFFIEFKQYGTPSGITTTNADYYIINDTVNYYLISTKEIQLLINTLSELGNLKKAKHILRINGEIVKNKKGDAYITEGFIISKDDIIKRAVKLNYIFLTNLKI